MNAPNRLIGFFSVLFLLFFCACTPQANSFSSARAFSFCMDTWVQQEWHGAHAQQTCDEIEAALQALEQTVSLYSETSEIAAINAAAGERFVPVGDEVWEILQGSVAVCRESEGRFDITIAPLSLLWDVTGEHPRVPSPQEIAAAQSSVDYRKLLFDETNRSVMLAERGMSLDLGAAAKGYAAAKMRGIVEKNGVSGFLSIGGNMLVVGKKQDGSDYRIGLRDPRGDENAYFATLVLDGYTLATTGAYERWFEVGGVRYHHVLDPFTGYPCEGDLLAVTVMSPDGLLADCLSTAIFLEGSAGLEAAFAREDCMVLAVTDTGDVWASPGFWDRLTPVSSSGYRFHRD